jgi:hypothetical protein
VQAPDRGAKPAQTKKDKEKHPTRTKGAKKRQKFTETSRFLHKKRIKIILSRAGKTE